MILAHSTCPDCCGKRMELVEIKESPGKTLYKCELCDELRHRDFLRRYSEYADVPGARGKREHPDKR